MDEFPKILIALGVSIALVGVIWLVASRFWGGAPLPGTLVFETAGGATCIIPILGSIILSIILTVLLNLVIPLFRK